MKEHHKELIAMQKDKQELQYLLGYLKATKEQVLTIEPISVLMVKA
jgi:hypothetical protein